MASILFRGKVYNANNIIDFNRMLEEDGVKNAHTIAERFMKEFNPQIKPKDKLKFSEVVDGAKAILNVNLGQVVDQAEITRRAAICTSCPLVSETSDCVSCGFGKRLNKFIGDLKQKVFKASYKVPNGMDRNYCKACGCSLAVMIPSKMEAFNESDEKQNKRPDHCWVKKSSINYKE